MSRPRQTLETIRSDFDRIALLSEEGWNHNARYHGYLLGQLPERCGRVLEVGCGTGEFTRLLAARAESVLAVDLSPRMVRLARERSETRPNVEFVNADAMALELPENHFDCVATLTTLHHLPTEAALRKIKSSLKHGGVFVCLDLYRRSNVGELFLDGVAYAANLPLSLLKNGRPRPPREVREAYAEHGRTDTYLSLREVGKICSDVLPGALLRRHLFWRYSVVWKKPESASEGLPGGVFSQGEA